MNSSPLRALAPVLALALAACGGGDDPAPAAGDASSILGSNAAEYSESNEAGNGAEASSELTGYRLDADGLGITGAFEGSGTTYDYYRFTTGGHERIDVKVFVDGVAQDEQNYLATITLNAFVDDGYSTLTGHGYFVNAWLSGSPTDRAYVLGISGAGAAGSSYVIELKAH